MTVPNDQIVSSPDLDVEVLGVRENLGTLRASVERFLLTEVCCTFPNFPFEDVMLAVQEACANVVRHAYRDHPPGLLRAKLELTNLVLRITIVDEGPPYDFDGAPSPDFANPTDGGYGLFLIKEIMSRVTYVREGEENHLIMETALGSPPTESAE